MQTLGTQKRKLESTGDLLTVVKTMKVLAAVNIRQYENAVQSVAHYNRAIEMGLQVVIRAHPEVLGAVKPPQGPKLGAIVFGSDQGMVGQFNELIVSFALEQMNDLQIPPQQRSVLAMGERILGPLENAQQSVEENLPLPSSAVGIGPVLEEVLVTIEQWRSQKQIDRIALFHHRPASGASYEPHWSYLLPIDLEWLAGLTAKEWPSRSLPTFTVDWQQMFSSLVRQYFFVCLYRAYTESLASENASRLAAMQLAEKNIQDRLEELTVQYNQHRQSSITAELLDIVSGFEALSAADAPVDQRLEGS